MTQGADVCDLIVSVIIPHRDTPAALKRCLESLDLQDVTFEYEVIVVDSSSVAQSWVLQHPAVKLMHQEPSGPGPARNQGAAAARGTYLAFIDADCRAAPGWLAAMVQAFEAHPEFDMLGGRIQTMPRDQDGWTAAGIFEAVFSYDQEMYVRRRGFAATANLATRSAVFNAVGGFAGLEILEDLEWCRRAVRLGFSIHYNSSMNIYHEPRVTIEELIGKWRRHVYQEYHTHYHFGGSTLLYYMIIFKVALVTPLTAIYLICSSRCVFSERFRTLPVLWKVRTARIMAMVQMALNPRQACPPWNG